MSENSTIIKFTTTFLDKELVIICDVYDNCLSTNSTMDSKNTSYNIGRRIAKILKSLV